MATLLEKCNAEYLRIMKKESNDLPEAFIGEISCIDLLAVINVFEAELQSLRRPFEEIRGATQTEINDTLCLALERQKLSAFRLQKLPVLQNPIKDLLK